MRFIQGLLLMLGFVAAIALVFVVLGVGVGLSLAWLIPGVGREAGLIAGAILALGIASHCALLFTAIYRSATERDDEDDESEAPVRHEPMVVFPSRIVWGKPLRRKRRKV